MPDELGTFEHSALEADMQRLMEEVRLQRERPEMRSAGDRKILKQSLQSVTGSAPLAPQAQGNAPGAQSPLPSYAAGAPPETKLEIEYLLDLAVHRGIEKAAAEAKKSNPYVLDAFHDALVEKLYPELQRRGVLK